MTTHSVTNSELIEWLAQIAAARRMAWLRSDPPNRYAFFTVGEAIASPNPSVCATLLPKGALIETSVSSHTHARLCAPLLVLGWVQPWATAIAMRAQMEGASLVLVVMVSATRRFRAWLVAEEGVPRDYELVV